MKPLSQRGFTLVEMIVAIVVMAIISIGLVQFITNSAAGYTITATRNQVSASGRVVIDRIAMDLHNALPHSVRVTAVRETPLADAYYAGDQCLEFIPVQGVTNYIDPVFRPAAANDDPFDVIEFALPQDLDTELQGGPLSGYFAVIYPTSAGDLYKSSYGTTEAIVEVTVDTPSGGISAVTPTADHRFIRRSPTERLFLVGTPVSYCVTGSKLYRYENYGWWGTQLYPHNIDGSCPSDCLPATTFDPGGGTRYLITDQIDNSTLNDPDVEQAFMVDDPSRRRNGVIHLDLLFRQSGEQVRMTHEILQQMVP